MNQNERNQLYFRNIIDVINSQIKLLKECEIEIHDSNDFDFVLEGIRYSAGHDSCIFYTKESEFLDEECKTSYEAEQDEKLNQQPLSEAARRLKLIADGMDRL